MKSVAVSHDINEPSTADDSVQELHLIDLLIVLAKRRRLIVWFTLAVAVLTGVIALLLPIRYTATTTVLPPGQNSSIGNSILGQLGGASSSLATAAGASLGLKNPGEMYVALFRSRTVEDAVIQRFGLLQRYKCHRMSEARAGFERRSTVVLGAKDGLIRITVTDWDAKLAADIANGYVDEFRKLSGSLAITEAAQRRVFFQQQLLEANQNLTAAEEAMKQTQQSTGVVEVESQARSLIESAARLRGEIAAKEVEIESMRTYATDNNPQTYTAQQELAALKDQLKKLTGSDSGTGSAVSVRGKLPEMGMEYLRKLRDVRYYETIESLIAKQFEMAKLDEAKQGAVVQVADVAIPPDWRSFPKRTIMVLIATFGALILVCAWCLVSDGIHRFRNNPSQRPCIEALKATLRKP